MENNQMPNAQNQAEIAPDSGESGKNGKKDKPKLTGKQRVAKEAREWLVSLAVALFCVFVIKSFIFTPIRVDGASMSPTLADGERLAVTVYDARIYNGIERGDVVICHYPERTNKDAILGLFTVKTDFVKRVVGLPGDTIERKECVTYINGVALDPNTNLTYRYAIKDENGGYVDIYGRAISEENLRNYYVDYEYTLKAKEYFVVGDNRYNSHDSREWNGPDIEPYYVNDATGDVGPITYDMIVGHARYVFWPLGEMREIETDTEYSFENAIESLIE